MHQGKRKAPGVRPEAGARSLSLRAQSGPGGHTGGARPTRRFGAPRRPYRSGATAFPQPWRWGKDGARRRPTKKPSGNRRRLPPWTESSRRPTRARRRRKGVHPTPQFVAPAAVQGADEGCGCAVEVVEGKDFRRSGHAVVRKHAEMDGRRHDRRMGAAVAIIHHVTRAFRPHRGSPSSPGFGRTAPTR